MIHFRIGNLCNDSIGQRNFITPHANFYQQMKKQLIIKFLCFREKNEQAKILSEIRFTSNEFKLTEAIAEVIKESCNSQLVKKNLKIRAKFRKQKTCSSRTLRHKKNLNLFFEMSNSGNHSQDTSLPIFDFLMNLQRSLNFERVSM